MAKKSKDKDTVSISRNGQKKDIPKAQWDAMKANNATYGWSLTSELSDEVLQKDKSIEASKISTLTSDNETLKSDNETLKASVSEKDAKIAELEGEVARLNNENTSLGVTIENLEGKIKELTPPDGPKENSNSKDNGKANK